MRISLAAAGLAGLLASLACTGLLPPEEEENQVDTGAEVDDGPDDGVRQTSSCIDYLACLEEAEPARYDDARDEYGSDAECWQSTKERMQDCDAECEEGIEALQSEHGEDACEGGEDTGTDTGSGTGDCPLEVGAWTLSMEWIEDECGVGESLGSLSVEVSCDGGDMQADVLSIAVPCTSAGREFACDLGSEDPGLEIEGVANSGGTTAEGTLEIRSGGCRVLGRFDGSLD